MSNSQALQRQEFILSLLAQDGLIEAEEIAHRLGVSIWTVRRDLAKLEARGALQRKRGLAQAAAGDPASSAWSDDSLRRAAVANLEAKQRIGRMAAQLVRPDAHVALSGGSTTLEVARALKALRFRGEIVTNALDIAMELSGLPDLRVVCTGGDVQRHYHTLAGSVTERIIKLHFFDVAVIGVSGIAARAGITVNSQVQAASLSLMIEHSRQVIFVADHSKFGRVAFASLPVHVPEVTLVTDVPLSTEAQSAVKGLSLKLVVATP
jgi:DeoR family transcriptional regulator of aga operon